MHTTNNALLLLMLLLLLAATVETHILQSPTQRHRLPPRAQRGRAIMYHAPIKHTQTQTHDPQHDKHTSTPRQTFTCIIPPNQRSTHRSRSNSDSHPFTCASTPSTTMTGPACLHLPARSRTPQAAPPTPPSLFPPSRPPLSLSLSFSLSLFFCQ